MKLVFNPFTGNFDFVGALGGGGGLTSFNGRTTAAAVPTAGDYDAFYYTKAQTDILIQQVADDSFINAIIFG